MPVVGASTRGEATSPVDRRPVTAPAEAEPERRTVNLGGGVVVPYPEPGDAAATKIGKANRRVDTKPELLVRSALHARGLRFRKDLLLRCGGVRVRPDVVFTRAQVAVFVDGCFWHSCPIHQQVPKRNRDYWVPKFAKNAERDRRVDAALMEDGWHVIRIWEHVDVAEGADLIEAVVRDRSPARGHPRRAR